MQSQLTLLVDTNQELHYDAEKYPPPPPPPHTHISSRIHQICKKQHFCNYLKLKDNVNGIKKQMFNN